MLDSVAPYIIALAAMGFCGAVIWTIVMLIAYVERAEEARAAEQKSAETTV